MDEASTAGAKWCAQYKSKEQRDTSIFYQCFVNQVPLLILGYGQSGSGKTSALIQRQAGKHVKPAPGAVTTLLNDQQVTGHIKQIQVQAFAMQANLWNKKTFSLVDTTPDQYIQQ